MQTLKNTGDILSNKHNTCLLNMCLTDRGTDRRKERFSVVFGRLALECLRQPGLGQVTTGSRSSPQASHVDSKEGRVCFLAGGLLECALQELDGRAERGLEGRQCRMPPKW